MVKIYLKQEEMDQLEEAAQNLRDKLLIRFLIILGCTISEALGLRVGDVDLDQDVVTIQHLKSSVKLACPECNSHLNKSDSFCPKCGVKIEKAVMKEVKQLDMRTLLIDKNTMALLGDYIKRGGPTWRDGKMLIFGIGQHRAGQIIKECAKRANIPSLFDAKTGQFHNITPRILRATYAHQAMLQNKSKKQMTLLQERLGLQSAASLTRYRGKRRVKKNGW